MRAFRFDLRWTTVAIALGATALVCAQGVSVKTDSRWERASDAWAAGRYPDALDDLRALLASADAPAYRDRVALLTGELFTTTALTTDGRNPRLSRNGDLALYETGPIDATVTHLVGLGPSGVTSDVEIAGSAATFNADGSRIVYLRHASSADMPRALAAWAASRTSDERQAAQAGLAFALGQGDLVSRETRTGAEQVIPAPGLLKAAPVFAADGAHVLFIGAPLTEPAHVQVYEHDVDGATSQPRAVTTTSGPKSNLLVDASGRTLVYTTPAQPVFTKPGTRAEAPDAPPSFTVVDLASGASHTIAGSAVTMSQDGSTIAWLVRDAGTMRVERARVNTLESTVIVSADRLDAPALSPDGAFLAYQFMPDADWDVYVADAGGRTRRITRDIRHDVQPRFLDRDHLLVLTGEPRDRRSYVYDLTNGERTRMFANNTVRTISPEYAWSPAANGRRIAVQADRDGDTVSPARGIYVVDLDRPVTVAELAARVDHEQAAESSLRARMTAAFAPIASSVADVVKRVAVNRAYEYIRTLVDFDSKYITEPGNARAIDYLQTMYRSFGYEPELQWFTPAEANGHRTANVVAIKKGTTNPSVVYVVSSHFDSVLAGPGADDDCSGTAALLETARILADTPLPATVVFASMTGEEAGLLGSREFVRRAASEGLHVAAALNNDMIGWSADGFRMDNTVRYSNDGIRDIQHGAAFLFTNLITYDARYYKSTDAQAFYDQWGDVVAGLGSYPVLANPNYHQATDRIETVDFQQVAETAKVTAATLMYLASSPARLTNVKATRRADHVEVSWQRAAESNIRDYLVGYGPTGDEPGHVTAVGDTHVTLPAIPAGWTVAVKAVSTAGVEGWDWSRVVIQ